MIVDLDDKMDGAGTANGLTFSSIGFGRTLREAFIDLRNEQLALLAQAKEVVRVYEGLKGQDSEDLEVSTAMQEYCEVREALLDDIRSWYKRSGEKIADHPNQRTEVRIKRVHDFFERIRGCLRETQPLGAVKGEDLPNRDWLNKNVVKFLEDIVPEARFATNKQEN